MPQRVDTADYPNCIIIEALLIGQGVSKRASCSFAIIVINVFLEELELPVAPKLYYYNSGRSLVRLALKGIFCLDTALALIDCRARRKKKTPRGKYSASIPTIRRRRKSKSGELNRKRDKNAKP